GRQPRPPHVPLGTLPRGGPGEDAGPAARAPRGRARDRPSRRAQLPAPPGPLDGRHPGAGRPGAVARGAGRRSPRRPRPRRPRPQRAGRGALLRARELSGRVTRGPERSSTALRLELLLQALRFPLLRLPRLLERPFTLIAHALRQ